MHAATFGGNPLAARAGLASIETIEQEGLLEHTQQMSDRFAERLEAVCDECDLVEEVRILGLMIGIELSIDGSEVVAECMKRGLLINCTQGTVLRLLPAMNISADEVDEGCDVLADVLKQMSA
jgi:acetylornithine/succinyldiaminopimelate/putrescine aminotransferase